MLRANSPHTFLFAGAERCSGLSCTEHVAADGRGADRLQQSTTEVCSAKKRQSRTAHLAYLWTKLGLVYVRIRIEQCSFNDYIRVFGEHLGVLS